MPITFDSSQFTAWSEGFTRGDWLKEGMNSALDVIDYNLKVPVESGQTAAAFANRVSATGTGLNLSGGIGNMEMVGDPGKKAPKGTISAFVDWYRKEYAKGR